LAETSSGTMPKKKQRRAANKQTKSQTKKRKKQLVKAGVSLKFGHESIKNNWNSKQTLRQNYKRLGLAFSVDEAIKSAKLKEEKVGVLTKELTEIQAAPKKEKYIPKSMPIDEQRRLIALMKKYGDNYKVSK